MRFNIEDINQEGLFTGEVNTLPSMVEPCHNPSISEMLLHPELMIQKRAHYDDGDSMEEVPDNWSNDIQTVFNEVSELSESKKQTPPSTEPDMPKNDGEGGQPKVEPTEPEE